MTSTVIPKEAAHQLPSKMDTGAAHLTELGFERQKDTKELLVDRALALEVRLKKQYGRDKQRAVENGLALEAADKRERW